LAVQTAKKVMQEQVMSNMNRDPRAMVENIISAANKNIFLHGHEENKELEGMGTTMVVGLITEKNIYFGNVGDSRAYLFKKPNLWQVTEDHSLVNEQVRAGFITEEESETVAGKNVITRSVGFAETVDVDVFEREITPGETYMMCSDGLCGLISNSDISNIFSKNPVEEVVPIFIEAAKEAGGDDNISVIVVQFEE
jgi:serine/threonine protein phosphatase PrpC